jgi:hypothetical protein
MRPVGRPVDSSHVVHSPPASRESPPFSRPTQTAPSDEMIIERAKFETVRFGRFCTAHPRPL